MKRLSLKSLTIAVTAAVLFSSCLKQNLYIAQDYQKEYRYADAIEFYKKSIEKRPTAEGVFGLAECYRILRDYPLAEIWYGKAYAMNNRNPEVGYQYAMMLKANGKYEEAKTFFGYYKNLYPADSLAANDQILGCDLALKWLAEPKDYEVMNRDDVNSAYSDFGMQKIQSDGEDMYVLSSNRPKGQANSENLAKENRAPYFELLGARMNDQKRIDQIFQYRLGEKVPYHIATPSFSANYDTVFFTQTRISGFRQDKEVLNRLEIFYSVKEDSLGNWSAPIPFQYNNKSFSTGHPFLSQDGNSLYFISDIPGGNGGFDIYVSKKVDGLWDRPQNLGLNINTRENEFYPVEINNTLYFSSLGHVGMGGLDIYYSEKAGSGWTNPTNLETPFNSSQDDFAYFESSETEGKEGFLSSNRVGGKGGDDVYSYNYIEPLPPVYMVNFAPKDQDGNPVSGTRMSNFEVYQAANPALKANEYTDVYGKNYFLLDPTVLYTVKASVPGYFAEAQDASYDQIEISDTLLIKSELPKQYGYIAEIPLRLKEIKAGTEYEINNIYFDFNSAKIRESAKLELVALSNLLLANKGFKVEIGSHCDARGSDDYNLLLSERRAKAVMNYLVIKGVDKKRLTFKGYGETELVNECSNGVDCTDEEHEQNRRTTFKIME